MSLPPAFPYHGGKARLAEHIVALIPDHRVYVEPFAGSLAVLLAKRPCSIEVVNDLNGDLVNFWRCLRDQPDDLIAACELTPYARDEFDAAWEDEPPTEDSIEQARRWWVKVQQGIGHKVHEKPGWQMSTRDGGGRTPKARTVLNKLDGLAAVAARIADVSIDNRPAADVIEAADDTDVVHYVDPPYVHSSVRRWTSGAYSHTMDDQAHRDLAAVLGGCVGTVLLSGYPSDLYDELYDGWDRVELASRSSTANLTRSPARRTEVVWSNRPLTDSPSLFGGAA